MKQYVIDEIRLQEYEKIKAYLDMNFGDPEIGGIYWIPLDAGILTDTQKAHADCQPFYFAIDLAEGRMTCELLVRTKNRIRCDCIAYATQEQHSWLIRLVDAMFEQLEIKM